MKKRIIPLILALAMLCALLPQAALTASAETYSGSCGANLTWSFDTETGLLTITGSGAMADYYSGAPWHDHREAITAVSLPEGLTSISDRAFYGCSSLTSVTIPDSVISICDYAFNDCASLASVTIPDNVTSIGNFAFCFCESLTSVTLGKGVNSIGWSAFSHCDALTAIDVSAGNPNYDSVNGVLFNKTGTELIQYPAGKPDASYQIPVGVTSIGSDAFEDCSALTSVTIPDSVTSIGSYAFDGCSALTSVTIPDSDISIGDSAFSSCSSLTSVTIGNNVNRIGKYAFAACLSLTSVTIPAGVVSIGQRAFGYVNNGKKAPSYVLNGESEDNDKIDGFTIYGYDGTAAQTYAEENEFTYISLGEAPPITGTCGAEGDGRNLTWSLRISNGLLTITGSGAMADYEYLGNRAPWYDYREAITAVSLPEGLTSIGEKAFYGCSALTGVTIPDSVTRSATGHLRSAAP